MTKRKGLILALIVTAAVCAGTRIHKYYYNNVAVANPGECVAVDVYGERTKLVILINNDKSHTSFIGFPIDKETAFPIGEVKYSDLRDLYAKKVNCYE